MRRIALILSCLTLLPLGASAHDGEPHEEPVEPQSSRVIVSTTLNSTLHFIDGSALTEMQPPLVSRGLAPVRLKVFDTGTVTLLLAANHGIEGSLGMFSLNGNIVVELPASPIPARPGSVGVDAANVAGVGPMAFVSNDWQALAPCDSGVPNGSVTGYRLIGEGFTTTAVEAGTVEVTGAIPYAVAVDEAGHAFATSTCAHTLETIDITPGDPLPTLRHARTRASGGNGPDGVLVDSARGRIYVTNIAGSNITVFDRTSPNPLTTVPLPGARAIDISFADTKSGRHLIAASGGGNDTAVLIDRDVMEDCIAALDPDCQEAVVLTAHADGAPEGIAFDPVSSRLFVVGKEIGAPILTAIHVVEGPGGTLSAGETRVLKLGALGQTASDIPSLIAFDVVVQTR